MERLMEIARKAADKVEVYSRTVRSNDVSFEDAKLKDIESQFQSGVGLMLMKDGRLGTAYTRNLTDREGLVRNALTALEGGVEADYDLPGAGSLPEPATYDPGIEELSNTAMVEECTRICEFLSSKTEAQINVGASQGEMTIRVLNSGGCDRTVRHSGYDCRASALYPGTYASVNRVVSAKRFERFPDEELAFIADTYARSGRDAAPKSGRTRVMFLPGAIYTLIWRLRVATSGQTIHEKTSPLLGRLGEQVFSPLLTVTDEPLNDARPGARAFDDEGTPCSNRPIVEEGKLRGYYHDRFYAWKNGVEPTGNGFRPDVTSGPGPVLARLTIPPGTKPFAELVREMGTGVIVVNAMGAHSGNILNGEYSIGPSPGLWVEKGEITGRVRDAMVSGNIYETLRNVVAIEDRCYPSPMGWFPAVVFDGVNVATKR